MGAEAPFSSHCKCQGLVDLVEAQQVGNSRLEQTPGQAGRGHGQYVLVRRSELMPEGQTAVTKSLQAGDWAGQVLPACLKRLQRQPTVAER